MALTSSPSVTSIYLRPKAPGFLEDIYGSSEEHASFKSLDASNPRARITTGASGGLTLRSLQRIMERLVACAGKHIPVPSFEP